MMDLEQMEAQTSAKAAELLGDWYAAKDRITRSAEAVEGMHADLLTNEQRMQAIAQQKAASAATAAENYQKRYESLIQEYADSVEIQRAKLHKQNYSVSSPEYRKQAAFASNEELENAMNYALEVGDQDLAKAIFGAAQVRGLELLVNRYLNAAPPEARAAYEELQSLPSKDELEKRIANGASLFTPPAAGEFMPVIPTVY